ncbi:NADPH dehydrogenase [Saccharibacillus sp. CPCC 101409]|uniref:oxidoreductase n=1 Tax=Saccharibacillus sp. CPCC 101409 TaxID=3058041 RepID=UPI0026712367|nr:NADPH dehydrogenase [Saccharibacillus sp. CPCC 101409]MDO3413271.1 NADPH dehydrogenase [Saccharibacillus sp. CPCC 101409]
MSLLFSPLKIGSLELKNRIMMSPMGTVSAGDDGKAADWHLLHYGARALGQVGLIMLEVTAVAEAGRGKGSLGLWSDEQIPALRRLVDALHAQGSKVGIQLWHAGRKSDFADKTVSASGLPHRGAPSRELSSGEIEGIVRDFGEAAARAARAGVDAIELHAAHGYLLNDFLSIHTNRREDRYGGSVEGRYRMLQETIDAVRSRWPGALFVRVSADEYGETGNRIGDTIEYAKRMKLQGVDLIDASSGGIHPEPPPSIHPGYQVPYADAIRREAGLPTAAVGLITTGPQAEKILRAGSADLIAIGRPLLRSPFWAREAAEQLGEHLEEPAPYAGFWFDRERRA